MNNEQRVKLKLIPNYIQNAEGEYKVEVLNAANNQRMVISEISFSCEFDAISAWNNFIDNFIEENTRRGAVLINRDDDSIEIELPTDMLKTESIMVGMLKHEKTGQFGMAVVDKTGAVLIRPLFWYDSTEEAVKGFINSREVIEAKLEEKGYPNFTVNIPKDMIEDTIKFLKEAESKPQFGDAYVQDGKLAPKNEDKGFAPPPFIFRNPSMN